MIHYTNMETENDVEKETHFLTPSFEGNIKYINASWWSFATHLKKQLLIYNG